MSRNPHIRLGTRGSALARWQADWVAARLSDLGTTVELVVIPTHGDRAPQGPIESLGSTGVFTKAIQEALLDERIDLAVHSLKDLPTEAVPGLALAAVPPRERCGDALISRGSQSLAELPSGSVVGTGSLRRQAQLRRVRPQLRVADIRGNVETRLARLDEGKYDAIVLAEAGLVRLGLAERITHVLPKEQMLPAVGQGALGLETRPADRDTQQAVAPLDDPVTHYAVLADRALLASLRGGCLAPVGAWGRVTQPGSLRLDAAVLSRDGSHRIRVSVDGRQEEAVQLGLLAAERLLEEGAAELLAASRDAN